MYQFYGHKAQSGVIYRSDYHEAKAADECPTTTAGIMVEGKQAGRQLYACTNPKRQTHGPHSVGLTPEDKAERQKQAEALRIQQEYRRRLLEEVLKRVPEQLARHRRRGRLAQKRSFGALQAGQMGDTPSPAWCGTRRVIFTARRVPSTLF